MASTMETLKRKARKQGFRIEVLNSGHLKWIAPDGQSTNSSGTPRSQRSFKAIEVDLRKIGFDPNYRKPRKETQPVQSVRDIPDRTPIADATESANCTHQGCGKRILNSKMAEHMLTHNIFMCTAPGCGKTFGAKQHLGRHSSATHGTDAEGNQLVECPHEGCGSMLSTHPQALESHFRKMHKTTVTQWQEAKNKPTVEETVEPEVAEEVTHVQWVHPQVVALGDEALLTALELLIGKEVSVPMGMIGDVNAWMASTRELVERLR